MVQRLGRVNRRGKGDACIEVIAAPRTKKPGDKKKAREWGKDWKERLSRLRKPLDGLRPAGVENVEQGGQRRLFFEEGDASPDGDRKEKPLQASGCEGPRDANPGAILDLRARAEQNQHLIGAIEAATTPEPLRPALTRALVDAWSLTSLDEHTGRPDDIQPWLRGWEEDQQPQTTVVWRKYLPVRRRWEQRQRKKASKRSLKQRRHMPVRNSKPRPTKWLNGLWSVQKTPSTANSEMELAIRIWRCGGRMSLLTFCLPQWICVIRYTETVL